MQAYLGELAALGTALSWSFGSTCFTISARIIGSMTVNRIRLGLAFIFLLITNVIVFGQLVPNNITGYHLFWFGISGFIGFTIGDSLLFRSFVLIGPRLSMLLMSLAPIFGSIIAWLFLHEILGLADIMAIIITLAGVSWVILEKHTQNQKATGFREGIICGLGGALFQAIGLVMSKQGLKNDFPAITGNLIRLFFATVTIWFLPVIKGQIKRDFKKLRDKKASWALLGGAIFGPFIGVSLSLFAVQHAYVGIASTLMALPPIFLIPLSHWVFKEKITLGAILGTIIAMLGVALIFLV